MAGSFPTTSPTALSVRRVTHDKMLLFGDSLTEQSSDVLSINFALTPALQHHYFRKISVVARGYGGYSTDHLRHVLLPTLRAETAAGEKIRLLALEMGTNDAAKNEMQWVTVEQYEKNMEWIVEQARAFGVERILIVGVGPVDEGRLDAPADKSSMRNLEYAEAARKVAEKHNLPFVDMWHALLSAAGWKQGEPVPGADGTSGQPLDRLLTDGVHLSGDGYRVWYDEMLKAIRESFPELRTEDMPTVLPHIFEVDRGDLPNTLWEEVGVVRR
jgi:lysophospholipase L1-like esterase